MSNDIVTRFAPSPTGFLHIGGARTALFNWLYAKAKGGRMLLRIEDTDRTRSTQEAITAILDGLRWLELDWDDEPVMQSSRAQRHADIAAQLLETGHAYRCYASPEELAKMREDARAAGQAPGYNGLWRDRDPADAPEGIAPVIRFKAPREGETVITDQVQGPVRFANKDLDDLVLLRSDGSPTYMLSVVVDDHDKAVTHVIRGDDHLTNAARQTQIYRALGWDVPVFAHVPLIHGPDGAKLSKRHGALGVEAYRAMGYLPVALRNYLVRLGWSHGDQEIFSTDELISAFDLGAIGRSPARFDFAKLENLNAHYIRETSDSELVARIRSTIDEMDGGAELHALITAQGWNRLEAAMPGLKARARTLVELIDSARYLFEQRPLRLEAKAQKLMSEEARGHLGALKARFEGLGEWAPGPLEDAVRTYSEDTGVKLGSIAQPLRAALTGRTVSPGIFDVLDVLGREESLGRIGDQATADASLSSTRTSG